MSSSWSISSRLVSAHVSSAHIVVDSRACNLKKRQEYLCDAYNGGISGTLSDNRTPASSMREFEDSGVGSLRQATRRGRVVVVELRRDEDGPLRRRRGSEAEAEAAQREWSTASGGERGRTGRFCPGQEARRKEERPVHSASKAGRTEHCSGGGRGCTDTVLVFVSASSSVSTSAAGLQRSTTAGALTERPG